MGKPKLKPLKQWFCDTCGQVIEKAEDGWIEWIRDEDGRARNFRICHHLTHSPLANENKEGCYKHSNARGRSDLPLDHFVGDGTHALVEMISFIDVGRPLDPEGRGSVMSIVDAREWADIFRRLCLPYYEEARLLFDEARSDGAFSDENEISCLLPDRLRSIISEYGS